MPCSGYPGAAGTTTLLLPAAYGSGEAGGMVADNDAPDLQDDLLCERARVAEVAVWAGMAVADDLCGGVLDTENDLAGDCTLLDNRCGSPGQGEDTGSALGLIAATSGTLISANGS
mmetsp:Transcript_46352/g.110366  ORF Transcript_46352/g.110366 Transcript_46352/m.110366 type:complete len:116 (+) Transcript_46352:204-551(+)